MPRISQLLPTDGILRVRKWWKYLEKFYEKNWISRTGYYKSNISVDYFFKEVASKDFLYQEAG